MSNSKPPFFWGKAKPTIPSLSERLMVAMLDGKRVLFLDDDKDLGELVQRVADQYKMELIQAVTAGDAQRILCSGIEFDAAILDIGVVSGNGITLYRWIKDAFPHMQVIFLTGLPMEEAASKVHEVGSAAIYPKPTLWKPGFFQDMLEMLGCRRKNQLTA